MMLLPEGTVTFLFTDIEGSTRLWETQPEQMRLALARHDQLLRHAIESQEGVVFKTLGDAFCAAFPLASDALSAALAAQLALATETPALRVRMALHTGTAECRDNDYFGQPLNRVARLLAAGHGGQILLSLSAQECTRDALPPAALLHSLGEHRLRDLGRPELVFQLLHPDLAADFPPLKSLGNPALPNNLPQQLTSFIGRDKESAEVKTLLARTRLLTLTGSGGCGKTRLSLQVAADVLENYPDGVWFVELASLADPDLVAQTVAQTLHLSEEAGQPILHTLAHALQNKQMLLLFDNCEHLLDACARLADTLLRSCPKVRILASSREHLGIAGETLYRIPSLSLPDPAQAQAATFASLFPYEAIRLFVDRATSVVPAFRVTEASAPALASVCHRLDGIPLAIELAAARVRSLSLEEINHRLDNRFRLLTGGSRTALPRQQTLRALVDWSYELLNVQEKRLLCRLSVFAGGWTLEAAEAVGSGEGVESWDVLDGLTSLADKSLVMTDTSEETVRYRLLETVRQYARDRLIEQGESHLVQERYADYFLTWGEAIRPMSRGAEQPQWLRMLEAEHDNLRQALTWYAEDFGSDSAIGEKGLRLGAALKMFWWVRGYLSEGRERLRALLAHPGGQEPTLARADALNGAGTLARMQGDIVSARSLAEESLAINRSLGNRLGIAQSLGNLVTAVHQQNDLVSARSLSEECLTIYRELGDKSGIARSLNNLGNVVFEQGDYTAARSLLEESLAIKQALGDKIGAANSLNNMGIVVREQGDYSMARSLHEQSLTLCRDIGDKWGISGALEALAAMACLQQQEQRAALLWGAEEALREALGSRLSPSDNTYYDQLMAQVRDALGEETFANTWAQGRALPLEQAIELALQAE